MLLSLLAQWKLASHGVFASNTYAAFKHGLQPALPLLDSDILWADCPSKILAAHNNMLEGVGKGPEPIKSATTRAQPPWMSNLDLTNVFLDRPGGAQEAYLVAFLLEPIFENKPPLPPQVGSLPLATSS